MSWEILHGDAAEEMERMIEKGERFDAVITDPPWPGTKIDIGWDEEGWVRAAQLFQKLAERVVIVLGCTTDPRILSFLPQTLPFLRVCSLEYIRPHYFGPILYTGDIAYVWGRARLPVGQRVLPGKCLATFPFRRPPGHPCPRNPQHMRWLVKWFGGARVLDPYMGSGTTGRACVELGVDFVGVEREAKYCELARATLEEAGRQMRFPIQP